MSTTTAVLEPPVAPPSAPEAQKRPRVAQRDPVAPPRRSNRTKWLGFSVVVAASVMDLLDSTITQTAAPAIRRELGGSYADLEWMTAAYTLALAAGLLLGSRIGDRFGRGRTLIVGIASFVLASMLCALAPDVGALIGARTLQGLTAAAMLPQGFGLIRELFGDEGQQKAFGVFGPIMGLAAVLGPIAGGGMVDLNLLGTDWRAIFLVNLPIGLASIWLGRRTLPAGGAIRSVRFDPASVALSATAGFGLVFPLIEGREHGWPAWCFALLAGAGLAAWLFVRRQGRLAQRGDSPLVEPTILRRRRYVGGLLTVVGFIGAMGGMVLALNVMFQLGLGMTPLGCGVATLGIPLAAIGGSITSSVLLPKLGRTTMHLGTSTMALGLIATCCLLAADGGHVTPWELAAPLALTGYGMGQVFVPMFDVILAGVAHHEIGSASGLLESVQQLGMSVGIAVVGTVLFSRLGAGHDAAAFVGATRTGLEVAIGFLVLAAAAICTLPKHARAGH